MSDQVLARPAVEIVGDDSGLQAALSGAEDRLERAAQSFGRLGGMLSAAITLPLTAMGYAAGRAAIEFESSFAGIRKTMDLTEAEFGRLSQANRDLAKTIPVSVNELNKIGELAGQLGIRGVDNVIKFEDTIAKLAVATDLTAEQAALSFAQIANVMRLPQDQIDRLGAAVVAVGNNFATTESRVVDFVQRISGAGAIAKLTTAEIVGIGTAFASLGIEAEAGGTAIQKVLLAMVTAIQTGGKELTAFAATAGMSTTQFAAAFREDAAGAFTAFVEGLGKQGEAAINTLAALGLEDQRLTRAFLATASAGGLLAEAIDTSRAAFEENTALTEEASRRFATAESRLTLFRNRVYDTAITVGQAFVPALVAVTDKLVPLLDLVQRAAQWFVTLPGAVQVTTLAMVGLAAAAGPVLLVMSGLIAALPTLSAAFAVVSGAIATLTATMLTSYSVTGLLATAKATLAAVTSTMTAALARQAVTMQTNTLLAGILLSRISLKTAATLAWAAATNAATAAMGALRVVAASILPVLALLAGASYFVYREWDVMRLQGTLAFEAIKQVVLGVVGDVLKALEKLVGWVPGFGSAIRKARAAFDDFALRSIAQGAVNIAEAERRIVAAGSATDNLTASIEALNAAGPPQITLPELGVPTLPTFGDEDVASKADRIKDALNQLDETLRANVSLSTLLGDSFDKAGADAQALRAAVGDLASAGAGLDVALDSSGRTVRSLAASYLGLADATTRAAEVRRQWQAIEQAGARVTQEFLTPQERLNERLIELTDLLFDGAISFETYERAITAARNTAETMPPALERIQFTARRVADSGIAAFVDFSLGAGDAIKQFVQQALRELAKLLAKLALVRVLSSFFPGSTEFISAVLGVGRVEARARGGSVQSGRPYLVGERGPELIVPSAAGTVIANDALGASVSLDLESLPPRPRVVTPDALALDDWWRQAFTSLAHDARGRGMAFGGF